MKKSETGCGNNSILAGHEGNVELKYSDSITPAIGNGLYTKLHFTVENGSANSLQKLLEEDLQALNNINFSKAVLLNLAILRGNFAICEILIGYMNVEEIYCPEAGGNTTLSTIPTKDATTPDDVEIFKVLVGRIPENMLSVISKIELLHKAASRGHTEMCDIIVAKNPNTIRDVDDYGCTAVHVAA